MKRILLALLLCGLFARSSQAALTVVQHGHTKQGTGSPSSITLTVSATGSGNLLVAIVVTASSGVLPSSVSDGTTNFTQFPSARVTGTGTFSGVIIDSYYLPSSNAGKTSITFTAASSTSFLELEVWEVSGFTTVVTDGVASLGTGGGTCSGTDCTGAGLTTTGTTGFLAAINGTNAGSTVQNPKSGNEFTSGGDSSGDGFVSLISSTAATHTPVWTTNTSNDAFMSITVGFKESSGGGTINCAQLLLTGAGRCG